MKSLTLIITVIFTTSGFSQTVPLSAEEICPILIGERLPEGKVLDLKKDSVSLYDQLKGQKTVLIYYRGGWCPYCNRQLSGINEIKERISELGFKIVAISPDDQENLATTIEKEKLGYELLSDASMAYARKLGIAFQVDEKTLKKYKTYNIDLVKASGYDHYQLPVPTVLLIDKKGIVQFSYINPNYKVRLSPEILLAALKALK